MIRLGVWDLCCIIIFRSNSLGGAVHPTRANPRYTLPLRYAKLQDVKLIINVSEAIPVDFSLGMRNELFECDP